MYYNRKIMCLAIPGKVVDIDNKKESATIDYGDGTTRKANDTLDDEKIGDYVLVHAGFAIEKLDEKEAQKTLDLFREILSAGDDNSCFLLGIKN